MNSQECLSSVVLHDAGYTSAEGFLSSSKKKYSVLDGSQDLSRAADESKAVVEGHVHRRSFFSQPPEDEVNL